jgi:TldD protein
VIARRFHGLCSKYRPFYADLRKVSSKTERIFSENLEINMSSSFGTGIGVRVLYNNRWSHASSNDIKDLEILFKRCIKMSRAQKPGRASISQQISNKGSFSTRCKLDPFEISYNDKKELLLDVRKWMDSENIVSTNSVLLSMNLNENIISSEGTGVTQDSTRVYFATTSIARQGTNIQPVSYRLADVSGYESIKKLDIRKITLDLKTKATRLLKAGRAPSGKFIVICDPELTGLMFHEALGHACEADFILDSSSVLKDKLNKRIASKNLSILDDPTRHGWGFYHYDDEGVKAHPTKLIDHGKLVGFLHSRQTAGEMKTQTTANGRSDSISNIPIPRMSNLVVEKGKYPVSELLDIKKGILAKGFKGGQVDITKGNFIFACEEAVMIKNGKKTKPLRDVAFSGNIMDILKNVDAIGNKQFRTVAGGTCGKKAQFVPVGEICPHVRVKGVIVGGAGK